MKVTGFAREARSYFSCNMETSSAASQGSPNNITLVLNRGATIYGDYCLGLAVEQRTYASSPTYYRLSYLIRKKNGRKAVYKRIANRLQIGHTYSI